MFDGSGSYELVAFLLSRGLGLTYLIAFLILFRQYIPLVGEKGLAPIKDDKSATKRKYFSLFYLIPKDFFIRLCAIVGLLLSFLVFLGITEVLGFYLNALIWFTLWIIFLSFLNSGQIFSKPGWDRILAESGFIAIFLGTLGVKSPEVVIWLFRWILFRMMFGSAIVKIRGGETWRNFTSLQHHFETQPFPGPLSRHFHYLPREILKIASLLMPAIMIIVPLFYFAPQPYASIAGLITVLVQIKIILGGNYAWLNLITIILSISTLNDEIINNILVLPASLPEPAAYPHPEAIFVISFLVFVLSLPAIENFFVKKPAQNMSYNPLHIGNSYGAFPWVSKKKKEIIIKGTLSENLKNAEWKEYKLNGQPNTLKDRPKQIAPYHHIFKYTLYFLAHDKIEKDEWFVRFLEKLADNDNNALKLIKSNPFKDEKPKHIKAELYHYEFTSPKEYKDSNNYWKRKKIKTLYCF